MESLDQVLQRVGFSSPLGEGWNEVDVSHYPCVRFEMSKQNIA